MIHQETSPCGRGLLAACLNCAGDLPQIYRPMSEGGLPTQRLFHLPYDWLLEKGRGAPKWGDSLKTHFSSPTVAMACHQETKTDPWTSRAKLLRSRCKAGSPGFQRWLAGYICSGYRVPSTAEANVPMVLEAGKSNVKVPARSSSGEVSLPGLQTAAFALCPPMVESLPLPHFIRPPVLLD